MNGGAWIRPPRGTYRNMTTAPEMSIHTPDRNAASGGLAELTGSAG